MKEQVFNKNRICIIMQTRNIYYINNYMHSRQLKLFDFGMPRHETPPYISIIKN